MLDTLFPCTNTILSDLLWTQSNCSQQESEGVDPRQRRWPKSIISFALKAWITSPVCYRYLSQVLYPPSEQLLQLYKNSVSKEPGLSHDMLIWLLKEIERTDSQKGGGILCDEMTIQPTIQSEPRDEGLRMFGGVDLGADQNGINAVLRNSAEFTLTTSVLQFVFLAFNGFRFLISYVINNGITASEIDCIFWQLVNAMKTYGFDISHLRIFVAKKPHCIATITQLRSLELLATKTPLLHMLYHMNWLTYDFWTRTGGWEFDRSHGAGTSPPSHWQQVAEQAPKPVGWMMCFLLMTFVPVQELC